jgi:Carboxypeptidase regulatory-like domain
MRIVAVAGGFIAVLAITALIWKAACIPYQAGPTRPTEVPLGESLTQGGQSAPAEDERPEQGSVLQGSVYSREDGRPVAGITVFAARPGEDPLAPLARCVSDSSGRYRLVGMPEGASVVWASCPGWVSVGAVTTGSAVFDGVLVELPVSGQAQCDLLVTRAAQAFGRIVDARGQPVAGVLVVAMVRCAWPGGSTSDKTLRDVRTEGASARTEASGEFAFLSLIPGQRYVFEIRIKGFPVARSGPHLALLRRPLRLDLVLGPERWLDVQVNNGDTGSPVSDALVSVIPSDGPVLPHRVLREWMTDGEGAVSIGPVLPQSIALKIRHDEYLEPPEPTRIGPESTRITVSLRPGGSIAGRVELPDSVVPRETILSLGTLRLKAGVGCPVSKEAHPGPNGEFRFAGLPAGSFRVHGYAIEGGRQFEGFVDAEANSTEIVLSLRETSPSTAGEAEQELVVRVIGPDGDPVESARGSAWTFIQGHVSESMGSWSRGVLRIYVSPAESGSRRWIELWSATSGERRFGALLAGPLDSDVRDTTLTLGREAMISGRVVDSTGAAVPGALILAQSIPPQLAEVEVPSRVHGRTVTDPSGAFTVLGLGEHRYRVEVEPPSGFVPPEPLTVAAGTLDLEIRLDPEATALITVRNTAGEPVVDALVQAGNREARTDVEGLALLTGLNPGLAVDLSVSIDGGSSAISRIPGWAPVDTKITLDQTWSIRGSVATEDGKPVLGARVRWRRIDSDQWRSVDVRSGTHRFSIERLGRESIALQATTSYGDLDDPDIPETIVAPGECEVVLRVADGCTLEIHVQDWPSESVGDARIMVERSGMTHSRRSAGYGVYRFGDLRIGDEVTAWVRPKGADCCWFGRVALTGNETLEVKLRTCKQIRGQVLLPEGRTWAYAVLEEFALVVPLDAEGWFLLRGVPTGAGLHILARVGVGSKTIEMSAPLPESGELSIDVRSR